MIIFQSILLALYSLWRNKLRSFLTMLGVVVGVFAVVTLLSIGVGLKDDVKNLIEGFGSNMVFVVAGKIDIKNPQVVTNPADFIAGDILTRKDVETIKGMLEVVNVSPLMLFPGVVKKDEKIAVATLVGAEPEITKVMETIKVEKGRMFDSSDFEKKVVVLGQAPAKDLFGDQNPLGKNIKINKDDFEVIGVFSEPKSAGALGGSEFETITVLPISTTEKIQGSLKIHRIVVKVKEGVEVKTAASAIEKKILDNHSGNEDFSVLTQEDILDLISKVLNLMTAAVSAIAAISLLVGGIGIMNIMLVTVTERTREIGLRKAVGATNQAILLQFLIEAGTVSGLGGVVGLALAIAGIQIIKLKTELVPVITPDAIGLAIVVSLGVGVLFGLLPALWASRKDPIEALRYE